MKVINVSKPRNLRKAEQLSSSEPDLLCCCDFGNPEQSSSEENGVMKRENELRLT